MNIPIPLWLVIGISFIMNMSGFILCWELALVVQRRVFQKFAISKKERTRLILSSGIGAFLFSISIGLFFDFLSLTAVNESASIQYIISQFASWSLLAIVVGIAAANGAFIIIQKADHLDRNK
jgi:hypothetical protein